MTMPELHCLALAWRQACGWCCHACWLKPDMNFGMRPDAERGGVRHKAVHPEDP